MSTNPETPTLAIRKKERYVKIAHISDLHFSHMTQFLDPTHPDEFLVKLADDLEEQQPDILCITGDIANSGLSKWLRSQELRNTFIKARHFFEELCERSKIDAGTALFIIPGNHDYRVQGYLKQSKRAIAIFKEVFEPYYRNDHLLFKKGTNDFIAVTIVCIDSNGTDPIGTFASGAITGAEFRKFKVFDDSNQVFSTYSDPSISVSSVFRVCLLHHHPLPVVTAESYRDLQENPGMVDKTQKILEALAGAQTTLLKNAGAFLSSALLAKVDLVLHGHEHKSWVSEIRYPITDRHRLLVVAAGSAGIAPKNHHTYTYNVVTLGQDAGLEVFQRSVDRNFSYYESQTYIATPTSELRELRYRKAVDFLRNRSIESREYNAVKLRYGALRADKMARVTRLQIDGNAYVTRSFEKLEATSDMEVRYLPLISHSLGGYQGVGRRPEIQQKTVPGGRDYQIKLRRDGETTTDWTSWILEFTPSLERGFPVTFEISYLLCNGYEFVTEYRRARQAAQATGALDGWESITARARAVFLDRLSETVIFPPGWEPQDPPRVSIYNSNGQVERFEQDYCSKWLQFINGARIVSLTVDLPLPDLTYELSWSLRKLEYENQRYNFKGITSRRQIAYSKCSNEQTEVLMQHLNKLKDKIKELPNPGMTVMDDDTEFNLFIVRFEDGELSENRTAKILLNCCAQLPNAEPNNVFSNSFDAGVGLVGQAYRRESVLFDTSEGRSGIYIMKAEQDTPHKFLCAVPLSVPEKKTAEKNLKAPIYAVLCFGSYVAGSGLESILDHSSDGATFRQCVLDLITGEFNNNIFLTLTNRQ